MADAYEEPWTSTDAWVLAAVPRSGRGIQLDRLIARMDAINHAIPTAEELSVALGALVGAGLVESHDGRFKQTAAGVALTRHWGGGTFEWADEILPRLNTTQRPAQSWPVTEGDVDRAYRRYVDR